MPTYDDIFLLETSMAEHEQEAYLALIAAHDPAIRALLAQGFAFVTNAFKVGMAPPGVRGRTDQEHVRRLQREGYQVEVSAAYDEQGQHRPNLSAIWP
jgi:3-isopropylmalate dehydratase small subunit